MTEQTAIQSLIEAAWTDRTLLDRPETKQAIREVIDQLDKGTLRCAEPTGSGGAWRVNEWVKKAVILYFQIQKMRRMSSGDIEFFDKMETKQDFESLGVRVVPNGPRSARRSAWPGPCAPRRCSGPPCFS